ncbi:YceD family protein [Alkalilimnicola sp. S0819]|uniref:YceD family protein n=1 Tax=Alkalilimnicola sp. S0819 TaxID=2613922 RepID=UPI00186985D8|nr:YceD family protein [Alkalilimnicola sp. S0819]
MLPLAKLERLRSLLAVDEGEALLELQVQRYQRRYVLQGRVQAELSLVCQRCLRPYRHSVAQAFELVAVGSEQEAERLPEEVEPLLIDRGRLDPAQVLQDELILAIPVIPRHMGEDECTGQALTEVRPPEAEQEEHADERPNPFSVLAQLKRDDSQD